MEQRVWLQVEAPVITGAPLCIRFQRIERHFSVSHPSQSEVHLQLGHSLPNTGPHAHPKGDEAVGVVLVVAFERCAVAQPALREEPLRVHELRLVTTDGVMAQMEVSLKRQTT